MSVLLLCNLASAEPTSIQEPLSNFKNGLECLKKSDKECAQLVLSRLPKQSNYAKILQGLLGTYEGDFDLTFRQLLPIQTDKTLAPIGLETLHSALALAYQNQNDPFNSLEQRVLAEDAMRQITPIDPQTIQENHQKIWNDISNLDKATLIEMRANSLNSTVQGWIDLAILNKKTDDPASFEIAMESWRKAYRDHPAYEGLSKTLLPATQDQPDIKKTGLRGRIAMILPFSDDKLYPVSDAISQGFIMAKSNSGDSALIKTYSTNGTAESLKVAFKEALSDGAFYIVGPLTLTETIALEKLDNPLVTLSFSKRIQAHSNPWQGSDFLSLENQIDQIIHQAQKMAVQRVMVISTDQPDSHEMAKYFEKKWATLGGDTIQIKAADVYHVQEQLKGTQAEMIFLAVNFEAGRKIRPLLDSTIPTYATSLIYEGLYVNPDDRPLIGVHFVDLPWLVDHQNPQFEAFITAGENLPPGDLQRWFAVGADAYSILSHMSESPTTEKNLLGLTGSIQMNASGKISRVMPFATFTSTGLLIESQE
jgi:uncharacterized protein